MSKRKMKGHKLTDPQLKVPLPQGIRDITCSAAIGQTSERVLWTMGVVSEQWSTRPRSMITCLPALHVLLPSFFYYYNSVNSIGNSSVGQWIWIWLWLYTANWFPEAHSGKIVLLWKIANRIGLIWPSIRLTSNSLSSENNLKNYINTLKYTGQ